MFIQNLVFVLNLQYEDWNKWNVFENNFRYNPEIMLNNKESFFYNF